MSDKKRVVIEIEPMGATLISFETPEGKIVELPPNSKILVTPYFEGKSSLTDILDLNSFVVQGERRASIEDFVMSISGSTGKLSKGKRKEEPEPSFLADINLPEAPLQVDQPTNEKTEDLDEHDDEPAKPTTAAD